MNPGSPFSNASRMPAFPTRSPFETRRSYGLPIGTSASDTATLILSRAVEGAVDHIHLLFARQAHEIHRITGDANRQRRVFLRMLHGVQQRVSIEHVHVHVVAGVSKEVVHDA